MADDEDYGFDSDDDAELIALTQESIAEDFQDYRKRKASPSPSPPPKRLALQFPSAARILKKEFGLKDFRLKQELVVSRILSGESAVVVFPTGGGKSLCYQLPALAFAEEDNLHGTRGDGEHGITLVVSPLIALMKDQTDALVKRGIKASTLDSTKSRDEYLKTTDQIRSGELKLLYVAPERLNNEGFVEYMKHVRGGIRLLAVDEAHCISEWGHAFRPDYLKIARFAKEIRAERVICLTATATPRVATDICKAFDIDEKAGLFRTSTYRPNLQLLAQSGLNKKELYPKLFMFLRENPGPTIIYVTLQKHTEGLSAYLNSQSFQAKPFHAGMPTEEKTKIQDDFLKSPKLIIVATIAFGMGIDKANIRNVIHFCIPNSLESYSQEIGRAGRDGKLSKCMFYVCGEDLHLREIFARGDLPSKESIRNVTEDIFSPGHTSTPIGGPLKFNCAVQEKAYDIRSTTLKNIYTQLELTWGLIRATTPQYSKYTWAPGPGYASAIARDKLTTAISKYTKLGTRLYTFDIDRALTSSGLTREQVVGTLQGLNDEGALELKPAGVINVFKVTAKLPQTPLEIRKIADAIYKVLQTREADALKRCDDMLNVITGSACFSRALAQHFGDSLPDGKKECGHCTWCMTHTAVEQQMPEPIPFNWAAWNRVLAAVEPRYDARLLAKVAFGISSPWISYELKLSKDPVFESMDDHNFMDLLRVATSECSRANQTGVTHPKPKPAPKSSPPKRLSSQTSRGDKGSRGRRSSSRGRGRGYSSRGSRW